ncbi:hypothetical protein I3760_01G170900 [Carya illinoinensis]|nr:hypothetical protein I3760_01G170900 [Carya illinoinensis]
MIRFLDLLACLLPYKSPTSLFHFPRFIINNDAKDVEFVIFLTKQNPNINMMNIARRSKEVLFAYLTSMFELLPKPLDPSAATSQNLEWKDIIMSFCFISVIAIALQSQQTHSNFPPSLYLLCFAMLLIFSALFVAKFISSKFPPLARALELLAVFVAAAAFFLAVAIPLPLPLKFATWAIFGVSLLTIIICNIL